jgi:hypothetical protein
VAVLLPHLVADPAATTVAVAALEGAGFLLMARKVTHLSKEQVATLVDEQTEGTTSSVDSPSHNSHALGAALTEAAMEGPAEVLLLEKAGASEDLRVRLRCGVTFQALIQT